MTLACEISQPISMGRISIGLRGRLTSCETNGEVVRTHCLTALLTQPENTLRKMGETSARI